MSTVESLTLPPLIPGQRLDRATFHERYAAMPPSTWAELIGGVVYIPSRDGCCKHGELHGEASHWLGHYSRFTKGLHRANNVTTQFEDFGEIQPDCQLLIPEHLGGQARIVEDFIVGPPELLVEIAESSRKLDLGPKKADYERAGVLEYVFVGIDPDEVRWFARRDGRFVDLPPGPDGIFRSEVFPGLWLAPRALLDGDTDGVITALDRGLATPEHAAFAARMSS